MNSLIIDFLKKKNYECNSAANTYIEQCNSWYANRCIEDFHKRMSVTGVPYELDRLGFGKRCCADDANLCEIIEINASENTSQNDFVADVLSKNRFDTMYRRQLEKTSALGTEACYVYMDNADVYTDGTLKGGEVKLNYVDADGYIPLTVINNEVVEVAFAGESLINSKKEYTVVIFKIVDGIYHAETYYLDDNGNELADKSFEVTLGDVKPFGVYRTAEVNNLEDMGQGYGYPKLWESIPYLKGLDLAFNVLFTDLAKAEKIILANDILSSDYDEHGAPRQTIENKKLFMLTGEKLPDGESLIHEYNPEIRIETIRNTFETLLSLLSMKFGYGTKKYTFESNQIITATEYIGSKQDQMQELNKQRFEAKEYITDIIHAVIWFSNTFCKTSWDINDEIKVTFDDSYITDKESEIERKRNDALSFDIPTLKIWYLMDAYNLSEEEAKKLLVENDEVVDEPTED